MNETSNNLEQIICNDPEHNTINAERAESRGLRKELIKAQDKITMLEEWIRFEGARTSTCTFDVLQEVCDDCNCSRKPKS